MKIVKGEPESRRKKYGIVVGQFNELITRRLLQGCLARLKRGGVKDNEITVVWVPGSFELPVTALQLANKKTIDAVICLGAVIRGETIHFELVAHSAASGIIRAALLSQKPVIFGVITTDTINQAYARSDDKKENIGRDAAVSAMAMVNVLKQI